MTKSIWRFRIWLAYHLVGDRSFAANVDIVGAVHFRKMVWGVSFVRDVSVFEDEETYAALQVKPRNARYFTRYLTDAELDEQVDQMRNEK
jgi:hypothetical protein